MAEEKKMTSNEAIYQMLLAINADRKDAFYKTVEGYAGTLAKGGDWHWKITRALKEKPMQFTRLDQMSADIKKLVSQEVVGDVDVCLPADLVELISELSVEWRNEEVFRYHGIDVRNKILLHGPTGNGKTTIAKYISSVVGLPFVEVNGDMVVDSHLGATGANIYKLFKNMQEPCVLFWDEIDSIGYSRGSHRDSSAGVENDRSVNSLLVNFDKMHPGIVFVAATNRMDQIDPAFRRRFSEVVEIRAPTEDEKAKFVGSLYGTYKIPVDTGDNSYLCSFPSYSDIKRAFLKMARKFVASQLV